MAQRFRIVETKEYERANSIFHIQYKHFKLDPIWWNYKEPIDAQELGWQIVHFFSLEKAQEQVNRLKGQPLKKVKVVKIHDDIEE
jgi:hypothetical protein